MIEHHDDRGEAALAQDAVLELLASSLDAATRLVLNADRAGDMVRISDLCARVGYLGEVADRLGRWDERSS